MDRGLTVEYLYQDADIAEVRVSASNGDFAGSAAVYVGRHEPLATPSSAIACHTVCANYCTAHTVYQPLYATQHVRNAIA